MYVFVYLSLSLGQEVYMYVSPSQDFINTCDYQCDCAVGWMGRNCQFADCSPNPCQNGGTCFVSCYSDVFCIMHTMIYWNLSGECSNSIGYCLLQLCYVSESL